MAHLSPKLCNDNILEDDCFITICYTKIHFNFHYKGDEERKIVTQQGLIATVLSLVFTSQPQNRLMVEIVCRILSVRFVTVDLWKK